MLKEHVYENEYWGEKEIEIVQECDGDCSTCEDKCAASIECKSCGERYNKDDNDSCPYCGLSKDAMTFDEAVDNDMCTDCEHDCIECQANGWCKL